MKRAAAALLTLGLLAAAWWCGRGATAASAAGAITPQQCIEQMFTAGERGEVNAYLACFTGSQRDQLEREMRAQSREAFADGLIAAIRPLKGRAIVSASQAALTADITVERIYAHRNDVQTYSLECVDGSWRIASVRAAQASRPPIAYGTPVFDLPAGPDEAKR